MIYENRSKDMARVRFQEKRLSKLRTVKLAMSWPGKFYPEKLFLEVFQDRLQIVIKDVIGITDIIFHQGGTTGNIFGSLVVLFF